MVLAERVGEQAAALRLLPNKDVHQHRLFRMEGWQLLQRKAGAPGLSGISFTCRLAPPIFTLL